MMNALAAALTIFALLLAVAALILRYRPVHKQAQTQYQQEEDLQAVRPVENRAGARRRRLQAALNADEVAVQEQIPGHQYQKRKSAYEEQRRKRDEEREAEDEKKMAEDALKEAEKQAAEESETAKWFAQMKTELEGTEELSEAEQEGLLAAFIQHIKNTKSVVLEEAAVVFGLRVQDVIARIQSLEAMGRLTGFMDDRGKFIYISGDEMEAVASYITSNGKVAISELAAKSNQLIDLEEKSYSRDPVIFLDDNLDLDDLQGAIES